MLQRQRRLRRQRVLQRQRMPWRQRLPLPTVLSSVGVGSFDSATRHPLLSSTLNDALWWSPGRRIEVWTQNLASLSKARSSIRWQQGRTLTPNHQAKCSRVSEPHVFPSQIELYTHATEIKKCTPYFHSQHRMKLTGWYSWSCPLTTFERLTSEMGPRVQPMCAANG